MGDGAVGVRLRLYYSAVGHNLTKDSLTVNAAAPLTPQRARSAIPRVTRLILISGARSTGREGSGSNSTRVGCRGTQGAALGLSEGCDCSAMARRRNACVLIVGRSDAYFLEFDGQPKTSAKRISVLPLQKKIFCKIGSASETRSWLPPRRALQPAGHVKDSGHHR